MELLTAGFRESFFSSGAPIASVRAGNVIGGGDWSADRLIPDCVRALATGKPVTLRYPHAVRPWQHVLEPLSGYLALAQRLVQAPDGAPRAVNFGPDAASFCTVHEVVDAFSVRFAGKPGWERDVAVHPPEAHALTLSSALAERSLGLAPRPRYRRGAGMDRGVVSVVRAGRGYVEVFRGANRELRRRRRA